ncbi:MAG: head GIN domain-containing protein [Salinivirgaceae bacterium]|jgi:hypothetical protein
MKTLKFIASIVIVAFTITSLNAQEKSEIRNVTGFNGIDVAEGIKVELTQGSKESVEVIADSSYIDRVVTELDGTTLSIHIKGNDWNGWNKKVLVKVTSIKVETIEASSGSSLVTQNLIESENLKMSVSSGAGIHVAYKAPNSSCEASSGASAKLKGVTKYFDADASSGANIKALELKAIKVKADVSSGASIEVDVEEELRADASSGGSVKYNGNPKMKDIEKSSGGSVKKE